MTLTMTQDEFDPDVVCLRQVGEEVSMQFVFGSHPGVAVTKLIEGANNNHFLLIGPSSVPAILATLHLGKLTTMINGVPWSLLATPNHLLKWDLTEGTTF